MSQATLTGEATLENIPQVGNTRRQQLRSAGYVNVGDVARADPDTMFEQTTGMGPRTVEKIINNARQIIGVGEEAVVSKTSEHSGTTIDMSVPNPPETDPKYIPDDQDDEDDGAVEETLSPEDFLDASPDRPPQPSECKNVMLVGGDDAFDVGGKYGDLSAEEQAQLVQKRLMEFGFEPDAIGACGRGMGRQAINAWVNYTLNETDQELPELKQFSAKPDGGFPTADDFQARNKRALEWADAVCVIANGDYVGIWMNMARDEGLCRRSPPQSE